jgi:hypothetical protein
MRFASLITGDADALTPEKGPASVLKPVANLRVSWSAPILLSAEWV